MCCAVLCVQAKAEQCYEGHDAEFDTHILDEDKVEKRFVAFCMGGRVFAYAGCARACDPSPGMRRRWDTH